MTIKELELKANSIRKAIVNMIYNAKGGHLGTSLSEVDILTYLFFSCMNIDPESPKKEERDRFILSKGHGSEGLYCTLQARGYFPEEWIDHYMDHSNPLTIHPTNKVPGIEVCTGALGHGLSIAAGIALSAKLNEKNYKCFALTGDGELQEGSNWEAAMFASQKKLDNFVWIIDYNKLQLFKSVEDTVSLEPIRGKLESFGFDVHEVDGNDMTGIHNTFSSIDFTCGKPHAVIAHTTKGKGISYAENVAAWHHKIPNTQEWEQAIKELNNARV
ncbi:MAG: transketolase [Sphaerochaetaceae bacterium]|nr:transketolase [Sphaerochaetaceae bacterium]